MNIQQAGDPIGEVLSLADAKAHCRAQDFTDDDSLIEDYITAASDYVQDVCQTVLLRTPFAATGSSFGLSFRGYPSPEITAVSYVDSLGVTVMLDASQYEISDGWLTVHGASDVSNASVQFTAGLGAGNIPPKLIQAVRMMVAHWYANREAVGETMAQIPLGVREMVALHRSFAFA
ncbi:head-tail connector protein [Paenirhodobacter populi]|uniref:head-tail connector protein n=1 Tax=Paenirhodobacter populi TaxID=2306993 RepID=UPI000FE3D7C5|nr:head-tail connector protein [Sinirhodobacter populi]RWR09802.1 phage gp6-like head-tail connector protein [Sinirhodobacter populi]